MNKTFLCTALLSALLPFPSAPAQTLNYTTSWIGNTFSGKDDKWVALEMRALFVAPDGTCYTNTGWDEGGREVGIYKNGDVVGKAGHTHGWGYGGGDAVTVGDNYLFVGQTVDNEGGGLKDPTTWPAKGLLWFGVSRRHLEGTAAPFAGGKGGAGDTFKSNFLLVGEAPQGANGNIHGLCIIGHELFVSDPTHNRIAVYDADSMAPKREWTVPNPAEIAGDGQGHLWVIQGAGQVVCYDAQGQLLKTLALPPGAKPTALCIDAKGRLLLADNGPRQQVLIYDHLTATPRLAGTVGVKGGVWAGERGRIAPLKFNNLTGVGADTAGNVYVSDIGGGAELKCVGPQGALKWQLQGLEFVDNADADPLTDGRDVYTKRQHFVMDYTKPIGKQWEYRGFTVDPTHFPEDPRLHTTPDATWVRRLGGKPFLVLTDMYSSYLQFYRLDGAKGSEIAVPSVVFAKATDHGGPALGKWPAAQPQKGSWVWRDANGDGKFEANEFDAYDGDNPYAWGWWVDAKGDVWRANRQNGLRWFPLQGFDAHGNPIYSVAASKVFPNPAPFSDVKRIEYDAAADTMYLGGFTLDHSDQGDTWWALGRVVASYPQWSKGNRTAHWQIELPFDPKTPAVSAAKAMSVAGDYLFVVNGTSAQVRVYRTDTGALVGTMSPGPEVGHRSGWVDIPQGIRAAKRASGQYLVFVEEDERAKIIQYQWTPGQPKT